jgi:chromate transport protein ChrA
MEKVKSTYWDVFKLYLPLSLISFGGPQAHVAMLHNIFVEEQKWVSDQQFTELFAIAQSLPGPASTQLAYAITLMSGGAFKALFSFLLWTLPGTFVMIGFAYGLNSIGEDLPRWLLYVVNGLTSAAVGLVALAANKIVSKVLSDKFSIALSAISAALAINFEAIWFYPVLMVFGGLASLSEQYIEKRFFSKPELDQVDTQVNLTIADTSGAFDLEESPAPVKKKSNLYRTGLILVGIWLVLLIVSIICRGVGVPRGVDVFTTLYFVGSIIFGGGPVIHSNIGCYSNLAIICGRLSMVDQS